MRNAITALLIAGGLATIGIAPAQAVGTRYPFCITGPEQPGLSNCTFVSYEQCLDRIGTPPVVHRESVFCRRK